MPKTCKCKNVHDCEAHWGEPIHASAAAKAAFDKETRAICDKMVAGGFFTYSKTKSRKS